MGEIIPDTRLQTEYELLHFAYGHPFDLNCSSWSKFYGGGMAGQLPRVTAKVSYPA